MKQYYCTKCKGYIEEADIERRGEHVKYHYADNGHRHQVMGQEEDAERLARESAGNSES